MTARAAGVKTLDPEEIEDLVRGFLTEYPLCLLLEAGEVLFDFAEADRTITRTQGKVVLHAWSAERNQVRRLVSAARRGRTLRLQAHRFGQRDAASLELVADRAVQSAGARDGGRERYQRLLHRVLTRNFSEYVTEELRVTMDLEHSFGPAYARGLQRKGQRAWAVVGVGMTESVATIDGLLTIGVLWLSYCRERAVGRRVIEGLRLFVPPGRGEATLARMAWLNPRLAGYSLYELDEATETLVERDAGDRGNVATRLVHAGQERDAVGPGGRFAEAIPQVLALLPEPPETQADERQTAHSKQGLPLFADEGFEMRLRSNAELVFLRHGLEFARIRASFHGESFNRALEVTVGSGAQETVLTKGNAGAMRAMVQELFRRRSPISGGPAGGEQAEGSIGDPLFRLQPERWLESLLRADLPALDPHLQPEPVYVQVPVITGANDRGMLDLLAVTTEHRLAVIEVKADEDLHFAMQGLDYWIRVRDHHLAFVDPATGLGDLQQHGYFPETRLLAEPPILYLVAPALRIHPATERVLRYFDPRVQWTLVALDERWRRRIRPVWRKRSRDASELSAKHA